MSASFKKIFLSQDFQSLSVFRILFSLLLLIDFSFNILPYYSDFYTDAGVLPRDVLTKFWTKTSFLSLLAYSDHPLLHVGLSVAFVLSAIAFGLGYKTRLANLVLFVCYVSLNGRNPMLLSGGELLVKLLLLWCLFLPISRYWSIDAALDPEPRERPYPTIPFVAIKIQIGVLYFFAALFKLAGLTWLMGTAAANSMSGNIYGTSLGALFAHNAPSLLILLTYLILLFQLFFTFLVYSPYFNSLTRTLALGGAAFMHLGFMIFLKVGLFPYICLIYLILLVPDDWWDKLLKNHRARLSNIRIYYEPGCDFCRKAALILREFCLTASVSVVPADENARAFSLLKENNSWVVIDPAGLPHLKWRAVAYVLKQNPLFVPLAWLTDNSFCRPAMAKFYDFIGARRARWAPLSAILLPYRVQPSLGVAGQGLCLLLLILALEYNVFTIPKPFLLNTFFFKQMKITEVITPAWLEYLATYTQVKQKWNLFAPNPVSEPRHFVLTGYYKDNSSVDLASVWRDVPYRLESDGRMTFMVHRWLKYFMYFYYSKTGDFYGEISDQSSLDGPSIGTVAKTKALASYVCRTINARHLNQNRPLQSVGVQFFDERPDSRGWHSPTAIIDEHYSCEGQEKGEEK